MTVSHRTEPYPKKFVRVDGRNMAYVELGGGGRVFLFLHGNPTSSYLWRNVMPTVAAHRRCLAVDLIGMGDSDKLGDPGPDSYGFFAHRRFLWGFIDAVIEPARPVTIIGHDWGAALGFDWANSHRERTAGIAYMETIVRPLSSAEWPQASRRIFEGFRAAAGEEMILDRNMFVERVLPASILRQLAPAEMTEYRRPFAGRREDRWPTLAWPRQIPLDGEPGAVAAIVGDYARWLAESSVRKLFISAEPGAILVGAQREFCRGWANQTEVTVRGSHFLQEDSGPEIGRAIADWAGVPAEPGSLSA
jgi:haloalkane dehalogenase